MRRQVKIISETTHGERTFKAKVLKRVWFFGWRSYWDWFTETDCEGDSRVVSERTAEAVEERVRKFYDNSGEEVVKEFAI